MKTTLFLSVLFCAITLPALGDLTDTDLNKIRLIINEEIKKESSTTNQKIDALDTRIQNVEKDIAWMRGKLESVDKQFESVDKQFESVDKQFESVDKQFVGVRAQITHVTYLTYGLIALIVAAVAIPQILITLRSTKDRSLEKQVEILAQEMETLKQQRIVNP